MLSNTLGSDETSESLLDSGASIVVHPLPQGLIVGITRPDVHNLIRIAIEAR